MSTSVGTTRRRRRALVRIAAFGSLAALAAGAGVVAFVLGSDQSAAGAFLGVASLASGAALASWVRHFRLPEASVEERHDDPPLPCLGCDALPGGGRRRFLAGATAVAGLLGLGVVTLRRDRAVRQLRTTAWTAGTPLVSADGRILTVEDLEVGSLVAAWPEGAVDAGDSQVVLLRLRPERLASDPRRPGWAPEGYVAYSRLCTHMGCPIGLYQQDPQVLVCPCHQAAFDVFDLARPVHGPAARPLPQLPLMIGDDGVLRAQHDFVEPVGPSFWDGKR